MKLVLLTAIPVLFVVSLLIALPQALDLIKTPVVSYNIPNNLIGNQVTQVLGKEKITLPPTSKNTPAPQVSAKAVLIEDLDSNNLLFVKNSNLRLPIASTTKIMTALIASEQFRPNEILTVPDLSNIPGSHMGLQAGETLMLRSILYGMLLNSGNDAAYTVSYNYPGKTFAFVNAMNQKVLQLNLLDTHFDNPAGFDSIDHYSSAADLAKISKVAIEDPQLQRIFSTKETIVYSSDKAVVHSLKNLNKLLDIPGVIGIKTGTTPLAKENLVGLVERDGHKILTVVLNSNDRFGESTQLIDWVFVNYEWK